MMIRVCGLHFETYETDPGSWLIEITMFGKRLSHAGNTVFLGRGPWVAIGPWVWRVGRARGEQVRPHAGMEEM